VKLTLAWGTSLDKFHERCVQQLAIQRSDGEKLNKEHIEERRKFYLLAAQLLETQSKVESLYENSNKITGSKIYFKLN
jgi:hypothetical protein